MANFVFGQENNRGYLNCENKKLFRSTLERLIPCLIDGQRLPRDISRAAFNKLTKRQSYKKSWNRAVEIGCSIIKKNKNDYAAYVINPDNISEVKQLKESRSFYYGQLMATYEKIEADIVIGKDGAQRITNSDRLWNAMIRTPERTRFVLESKVKPYLNTLKKNNFGSYVYYDKLITEITLKLMELDTPESKIIRSLNEDFILGYYYQKNAFYKKRDKKSKTQTENVPVNAN